MPSFDVGRDPLQISLQGADTVTIKVVSGDTVYYGYTFPVTASSNAGSLTAGQSATLSTEPLWVVSASRSSITTTFAAAPQDIRIGSDGTVGGPGGTALTGTVVTAGSVPRNVRTVAAAASPVAAAAGDFILADATAGAITVNLPASVAGTQTVVKKTDASANTVGVVGTIDGASNATLAYQGQGIALEGDGSGYQRVVRQSLATGIVDYPATPDTRYVRQDGTGLPASVATTSSPHPEKFALVDPNTTPYTVYVDRNVGSDANRGNSLGQAFATLAKAINTLQQAGQGGEVVINGVAPGFVDVPAPIAFCRGIFIRALGPSTVTIRRTFTTPDGRSVWDAVTTAAGGTVTSATATFDSSTHLDDNAIVEIYGAGTAGGSYYDFISSVASASVANLLNVSGTAVARNSTTDPKGVRMRIVRTGDQGRIVTDASITAPAAGTSSVITSAAANFAAADIGTELVIAGAGQGGQALRSVIKAVGVSGGNTTATIVGTATTAVAAARCAIGVNFGNLFTDHVGNCGFRNVEFTDTSSAQNNIGALWALVADDQGAGSQPSPSDIVLEHPRFTSTDTAGAFEHIIDIDGSWNQAAAGPGDRRIVILGAKIFGSRRAAETVRINSAVHCYFVGGGMVGNSPTSIAQGIMILDPQKTAGGSFGSQYVNFAGFEAFASYFYCEAAHCSFTGEIQQSITLTGHRIIEFGPTSDHCSFVGSCDPTSITAACADEYDAGTNNVIETNTNKRLNTRKFEGSLLNGVLVAKAETFPRQGFTSASQTIGSSGVMACFGIWLPGGLPLSKVLALGGGTALAWGSSWTGQHFLVGLYDPDGKLFAQSNDLGGSAVVSNAFNAPNLVTLTKDGSGTAGSSFPVPRSGLCYISYLINSGTGGSAFTYPSWGGVNGNAASNAAPVLAGSNGSALTSLPGGPIVVAGVANQVYAVVG